MEKYLKILYNFIYLHASSRDCEDILQDTLLAAWQGLQTQTVSSLKPWLIGIARHKVLDRFRTAYRAEFFDIENYESLLIEKDETETLIARLDLAEALKILNNQEAELVFMVYAAGLSYTEISAITGVPVGTIKSRIYSIKSKLRKKLSGGTL